MAAPHLGGGIVFERSEAPFPRLWGPGSRPHSLTGSPQGSSTVTGGVVLMFFMCLLLMSVDFC